jgi:hypothetical protein
MANIISPLRPPTLASVRTWGIQQELVATFAITNIGIFNGYAKLKF